MNNIGKIKNSIFEGSYLKRAPWCIWFSKQNIFVTIRDTKNSKLGLCRGRSGLSCHEKFWSTLVDQTCENFGWSEKVGQKTSFFHEVLKVEGVFTGNRFVSMIRCSKHFGRTCFHPNLLMSSYLVNWRKKKFPSFVIFHFFDHFYLYFPY